MYELTPIEDSAVGQVLEHSWKKVGGGSQYMTPWLRTAAWEAQSTEGIDAV